MRWQGQGIAREKSLARFSKRSLWSDGRFFKRRINGQSGCFLASPGKLQAVLVEENESVGKNEPLLPGNLPFPADMCLLLGQHQQLHLGSIGRCNLHAAAWTRLHKNIAETLVLSQGATRHFD